MALADKLSQQVAENKREAAKTLQETNAAQFQAEVLQKQKLEEVRLVNLRRSIESIDSKVSRMRDFFTELTQVHERAGASVAGAKKEGKALKTATAELEKVFQNEEFRLILAEKKIYSVDDLLNTEHEFSKDSQVSDVKESRESRKAKRQAVQESIAARRGVKVKAHKALLLEKPDVALTYKSIASTLEEVINTLEQERKKLFHQTPEGQASLKAEIFERITKDRLFSNRTFTLKLLDERPLVERKDLRQAEEYPEEYVKETLKHFYEQIIDQDRSIEAKKMGFPSLKEAVRTIENLPARWEPIQETVQKIKFVRSKIVDWMVELLGEQKDSPFFRLINQYGDWHDRDPAVLAEHFVQQLEKNHFIISGQILGVSTQEGLERMIVNQKNLAALPQIFGTLKKAFYLTGAGVNEAAPNATDLVNPELIAVIVAKKMEFYTKLDQAFNLSFEEIFKKIKNGSFFEGIDVKFTHDENIKDRLCFDAKTYVTLRDGLWPDIKFRLEEQEQNLEKNTKMLKERMAAKVEADWHAQALSVFSETQKQDSLIQEIERLLVFQKKSKESRWPSNLALVKSNKVLKEALSEGVQFDESGRLSFSSVPEAELKRLNEDVDRLESKIKTIQQQIDAVDGRALKEGDGLFYLKKNKRETEKGALEKNKSALTNRLNAVQNEYQPKMDKDKTLDLLRSWLLQSRREGFALATPPITLSLESLFDYAEKQLDFSLSPEQQAVYERYQALMKKRDEAMERYQKIKG